MPIFSNPIVGSPGRTNGIRYEKYNTDFAREQYFFNTYDTYLKHSVGTVSGGKKT